MHFIVPSILSDNRSMWGRTPDGLVTSSSLHTSFLLFRVRDGPATAKACTDSYEWGCAGDVQNDDRSAISLGAS